jgi:hypothetical protein
MVDFASAAFAPFFLQRSDRPEQNFFDEGTLSQSLDDPPSQR